MEKKDLPIIPTPSFAPRSVRNKDIMLRAIEGQSPDQIADYYNLSVAQIKQILSSPLVKQQMQELQVKLHAPVLDSIRDAAGEAVDTIVDTMRGEVTSELRMKAAKSLLDYNPEIAKKDSAQVLVAEGLGEAIIRELKRARSSEAIEREEVIEAKVE